MFCGHETVHVSRGVAEGNTESRDTELVYTKSQRNEKIKRTSQKYINYFINFVKNVKFNSAHNVIHKTFTVFGCPKVACSRDGARDFLLFTGE